MKIDEWLITPARRVSGVLSVPGDKSVSHRVAMLASLADGQSEICGFLRSEDCLNTLSAVEKLGATIEWRGEKLLIRGTGGQWDAPDGVLDLGNSGTGMRLIAGLLAGQPFTSTLTGDASLCSRPMDRVRIPLELMGAKVESADGGCAPLTIHGGELSGIEYRLPVASAQVKSCVLLAGLMASGVTVVEEPKETRDHTERLLSRMGCELEIDGLRMRVKGSAGQALSLKAGRFHVPADFSSAAFWLGAAAAASDGSVHIRDLGVNPRRTALLDVLQRMGATVEISELQDAEWEPKASVKVKGAALKGTVVCGAEIPNLIDELPLVAVLGALAEGVTEIRDAAELRVKESDRISAMASALRSAGVKVEEKPDGMVVHGGDVQGDCVVQSRGDHRIAMAMAVLALHAQRPICIHGTACVATSYPQFMEDLERVVER